MQKENKIKFWQLQKEAALTNKQAAELFDVSKRCIEKWRIDKPEAPKAVVMCLQSIINETPVSKA